MALIDGKYKYKPEKNYYAISESNSEEVVKVLQDFKKGYIVPLEDHILTADSLRKFLNSSTMPQEIQTQVRIKIEDIDRELKQIVRLYSDVESKLDTHELDDQAMHLFHAIFTNEELTESKRYYARMINVHKALKHFNTETQYHWNKIAEVLESIRFSSQNQPFMDQALEFKVYPRMELCEQTELLIRRLEYILKLPGDQSEFHAGDYKGNYSSLLSYNIGTIFLEDLDKYILADNVAPVIEETKKVDNENTCIADPFFLDSRGAEPFNQSYLYTLSLSDRQVTNDTDKIKKAVYLETHLTAEDVSLRQDMIRHFVSASGRKDNITNYKNFLNNHFDFTYEGLLLHFGSFSKKEKVLLAYHIGPVFFLKLIMQFLREGRTGYIHRFMGRNTMARELPFEFIKFTLKDWWDTNVYKLCDIKDRNSRDIYEKILIEFKDKWTDDQKEIYRKIVNQQLIIKSYHQRDYKALRPFLEKELSFLFYILYSRFLGTDFLYLPFNKLPRELIA